MGTIKLGSRGNDVKILQQKLGITPADGIFGHNTERIVKQYQQSNGLVPDGIVGQRTWDIILDNNTNINENSTDIYIICANKIGCETRALKAVKIVETGNYKSFIAPGKPPILFEGHIFWRELQKRNISPNRYLNGNRNILYKSWTRKYYKGGIREYERLEQAKRISVEAAYASASWGMFQVLGNNYRQCNCKSVIEFVNLMCRSEEDQLILTTNFIINHNILRQALIRKDWVTFARYYNGPAYAKNNYHTKLQRAYRNLR